LNILEHEYNIPINNEIREEVTIMCNLSAGIEEKTKEKIILNMYKKGYTLEQIADVAETSMKVVETIIEKKASVLA
jgi:SOS response regulatory protein OraA/RecX